VISDVIMPLMGGREMADQLKLFPSGYSDPIHVRLHRRCRHSFVAFPNIATTTSKNLLN